MKSDARVHDMNTYEDESVKKAIREHAHEMPTLCPNPWHRSAPARMEQDCPECRTPPEAVTVEMTATFTMSVSIADWIMAYGTKYDMVPADARAWLENMLHTLETASDVQGQIVARVHP
jgi:hypothetical protein